MKYKYFKQILMTISCPTTNLTSLNRKQEQDGPPFCVTKVCLYKTQILIELKIRTSHVHVISSNQTVAHCIK